MVWTELHAKLLSEAFERVLGRTEQDPMAFVRCLPPEVVNALAGDTRFAPEGWLVRRVADVDDPGKRTITADCAVELRESKSGAVLFFVDTSLAGAGMDGIYNATREVDETTLFKEASRRASAAVKRCLSSELRRYAEQAIKKAQGRGQRYSLSPWTAFDFLVRVAAEQRHPGELLYLLGLWPVQNDAQENGLDLSRLFVDRLLGSAVAGWTALPTCNSSRPTARRKRLARASSERKGTSQETADAVPGQGHGVGTPSTHGG